MKRWISQQIAMKSSGSSGKFWKLVKFRWINKPLRQICPTKVDKEDSKHMKRSIRAMRIIMNLPTRKIETTHGVTA
jgi:hypothetical protein